MLELTVGRLDELSALAFAREVSSDRQFIAAELSAYMEWYWLRRSGHSLGSLAKNGPFAEFHERLRSGIGSWTTSEAPARGFIRVRRNHTDTEHARWVMFLLELQKAGVAGGFGDTWIKQIVGAVGELEDNIHWHSEAPKTGIVAYWLSGAELDLVVLDRGVGVLKSLRRANEFNDLADYGTALQLATSQGTSRYGTGSGRGWGFNELFVALANSRAQIRFRSGDHLLAVEGRTGLPEAQLRQRAVGQGLLVSVRVPSTRG